MTNRNGRSVERGKVRKERWDTKNAPPIRKKEEDEKGELIPIIQKTASNCCNIPIGCRRRIALEKRIVICIF